MYRGRIVERGPVRDVLRAPAHPYTQALIDAVPIPDPAAVARDLPAKLLAGAGEAPAARGCPFVPRCIHAIPQCEAGDPPDFSVAPTHLTACIRAAELRKAAQ
jgi:oligopeptide/dipeptide ABC transporter ATP-binding protein